MSTLTEQITAINDQVRELRMDIPLTKDQEIKEHLTKRITLLKEAQESLSKYRSLVIALQVEP